MLHMQHHFLCNISYVVITESMEKSLKYTTNYNTRIRIDIITILAIILEPCTVLEIPLNCRGLRIILLCLHNAMQSVCKFLIFIFVAMMKFM